MAIVKRPGRGSPGLRLGAALLACLLALLLLPPATPVVAQGATPGSFAPAACPLAFPEGVRVDCGYLTVAESRQKPGSRTIQLAVAILRSSSPNPRPDPVILLSGGPGEPSLPIAALAGQLLAPILAERDVVFMDQRGTGYSRPALNCGFAAPTQPGSLFPLSVTVQERPAVLQAFTDQLIACGAQYRAAGVDLSGYNSVESAADIEDLRVALGYPSWNLYGFSYGTRLGLTIMRYRPQTIRSAVLDSVYPLEANFHTGIFASYNRSLQALAAACNADAACGRAYPNIDQTFGELVPRLNAEPVQLPILNLETGEVIDYLPFSGVNFSTTLFQLLYITQVHSVLPALIGETAKGNLALLSSLASALFSQELPGDVAPVSLSMQVAVQCNEDATFARPRDFVAARDVNRRTADLAIDPRFHEAILEVCAAWGLGNPSPAENQQVRSEVPALLIGGELDPITPPQNAWDTGAALARSQVVIYPRGGHSASLASPCLGSLVVSFFNAPDAPVNRACLAQEPPAPFLVLGE